jgi:aarF domain-containing kinase
LVNRDFESLTKLFKKMGFIPESEDAAPIVQALEAALPDVLDAPVGELNIKNVVDKLGAIFYEYPFSLPPFYIALIRCLGVLEGLALQVDDEFQIISRAYPYISSRLLTDGAPELERALQQLLFKEGEARWDRLVQLAERAGETRDYDVSQAVDKLVDYLLSEKGEAIREQLIQAVIEGSDGLGAEASAVVERMLLTQSLPTAEDFDSPRLATFSKLAEAIISSRSFNLRSLLPIAEKLGRNPLSQQAGVEIFAAVSERAIARGIRLAFGLPSDETAAVHTR